MSHRPVPGQVFTLVIPFDGYDFTVLESIVRSPAIQPEIVAQVKDILRRIDLGCQERTEKFANEMVIQWVDKGRAK